MVNLDGINLFGEGESQIEVGSFGRESIERSAAGLDGVMSIDLGRARAGRFGKRARFGREARRSWTARLKRYRLL